MFHPPHFRFQPIPAIHALDAYRGQFRVPGRGPANPITQIYAATIGTIENKGLAKRTSVLGLVLFYLVAEKTQ
jgi:hypothetical protein